MSGALYRLRVVDHIIDGDRQRGLVPLNDIAERITDKQDIDTNLVKVLGKKKIVCGEHGNFFARCFHRHDGLGGDDPRFCGGFLVIHGCAQILTEE